MATKTYIQAIAEATIEEMERDQTVFTMGEDLRQSVYGATAGLVDRFGEDRVLDTPPVSYTHLTLPTIYSV